MSDVAVSTEALAPAEMPDNTTTPLRAARTTELENVHCWLMEAIESSPFYNDAFKAYEKNRLTPGWLRALYRIDPHHVMVMRDGDSEAIGFMISGPELGTIWLYWSYLLPEKRRSSVAMGSMRAFVNHWDHGRFHKIATYTKDGNNPAAAIMLRFGFEKIAVLRAHIFGEDYLLFEKALTKSVPGYDHGVGGAGIAGRLRTLIRRVFKI